ADIPEEVLGQLGLKIQHALRAFTAKDRKAIKLASQNYPISEFYDVDQLLTELGTGEALVTALDHKGRPSPLVHCLLRAPESRMDILTNSEIKELERASTLVKKYNKEVDRESAYEILSERIEQAQKEARQEELRKEREKASRSTSGRRRKKKSLFESLVGTTTVRQMGRTVARELSRGLLGMLGGGSRRR
ncbi:MAG: helicase HerA-like domain-containing protein, partial [Bacteroidota bacterium]